MHSSILAPSKNEKGCMVGWLVHACYITSNCQPTLTTFCHDLLKSSKIPIYQTISLRQDFGFLIMHLTSLFFFWNSKGIYFQRGMYKVQRITDSRKEHHLTWASKKHDQGGASHTKTKPNGN